jgi:hypothetical protein
MALNVVRCDFTGICAWRLFAGTSGCLLKQLAASRTQMISSDVCFLAITHIWRLQPNAALLIPRHFASLV